jgi:hypothetical protein
MVSEPKIGRQRQGQPLGIDEKPEELEGTRESTIAVGVNT